jgi:hypothetical protein
MAEFPEKAVPSSTGRHRGRCGRPSPDPARLDDIVGIDKSGIPTDIG